MHELKTTSGVIANDSDPDMNEALRRMQADAAAAKATSARTYAAAVAVGRQLAAAAIAANPELPTTTAALWHGETITLPVPEWNADDIGRADPQHPEDVQYRSGLYTLAITGEDGTPELLATLQLVAAPLNAEHAGPWLAFATVSGDISMDLDLAGADRLIAEYEAGLAQLLAARAALAEATAASA